MKKSPKRTSKILRRDIVVVGASAGGIEALKLLVAGLPDDFAASMFVVVHTAPGSPGKLAEILAQHTRMPVDFGTHGEEIRPGRIVLAPADNHLTLDRGLIRVVRGPKDNGHRPAVDPLFQTAARAYGSRVIGVVLSGALSCGTAGIVAIKSVGGLAIVQDPDDAAYEDMPRSALAHSRVDHVVPATEIGPLLGALVGSRAPAARRKAEVHRDEVPAGISCPECAGAMTQSESEGILRFRCHVGHAFSPDALVDEQSAALEAALWASVRVLEESADMASRFSMRSGGDVAQRLRERSKGLLQHAALIRRVVTHGELLRRGDAADLEVNRPHE
jgi:two-component system chemotaxis response regulator CheB